MLTPADSHGSFALFRLQIKQISNNGEKGNEAELNVYTKSLCHAI